VTSNTVSDGQNIGVMKMAGFISFSRIIMKWEFM